MHYGSPSCIGINMQTSVEIMVIELGLSLQPFAEDYDACQHWDTPSWLKSVWEKSFENGIDIQLAHIPLQPPREHDSWIMAEFIRMNYNTQSLCTEKSPPTPASHFPIRCDGRQREGDRVEVSRRTPMERVMVQPHLP